jgi:micrococcal nuclease
MVQFGKVHITKRQIRYILSLIVVIIALLTTTQEKSVPITPPYKQVATVSAYPADGSYLVLAVIDGDTITVDIHGVKETVRFIGIDTPEVVDPRKPVQCFGKEASLKAKELLQGKRVILESDSSQDNRDKYKRLLRFVFLEDGTNINKFMITEGYAHEYTYQSKPYKYQEDFIRAQNIAREQKRGLWGDGVCVSPTPEK